MNQIQILREVVTKLTPMLAGRGLRVTQIGTQALCECDRRTGKPIRINIPMIPDDASEDFCRAIQGFIDHEVAHALFTDWATLPEVEKIADKIAKDRGDDRNTVRGRLHSLANIVEDTFIEREMCKRFKGTGYNLDQLYKIFLGKITAEAVAKTEGNDAQRFNVLLVPLARAWAGQTEFDRFLKDGGHYEQRLIAGLIKLMPEALIKRFPKLKNSWECLDVAQALYDILHPPAPPPPPPPPPPPMPGPSAEGDKAEDSKSESEEKCDSDTGKGDAEDKPEDEDYKGSKGDEAESEDESGDAGDGEADKDEDADGEEGAESEADPKDGDDDEGDADGEEDEAGGDAEDDASADDAAADDDVADDSGSEDDSGADDGEEEESGSEEGDAGEGDEIEDAGEAVGGSKPGDDEGGAESGATEGKDEPEAGEDTEGAPAAAGGEEVEVFVNPFLDTEVEVPDDMAKVIGEIIGDEALRQTREADYTVLTRDWDEIAPPKDTERAVLPYKVAALEETVRGMVGPMQKAIERMMAARSQAIKIPGFRSGKLHGGSLHRLTVNDDRVFRKIQVHRTKETAVTLLVDNSGSMNGPKIHTAMHAAYALSQTLERVGVKHEVLGFTCYEPDRKHWDTIRDETARLGRSYTRVEPLYMPIYKGFEERINPEIKKRFVMGYDGTVELSGNVDGECVRYAGHRLLQRREPRKVMIVLSDGQPAGWTGHLPELYADLHRAVKELTDKKVDVVGLGIMTDAVKTFYPKHSILKKLDQLPGAVMGELTRILATA